MSTDFSSTGNTPDAFCPATVDIDSLTSAWVDDHYPVGTPRTLSYPHYPAWGLLHRSATLVPERPAVHFLNKTLTYAEVETAASNLAMFLHSIDVQPGDRVGILLPNSPEYLVALNGIWKVGGVAVAISPLCVAREVADLIAFTECKCVIALDVLTALLRDAREVNHTIVTSMYDYLPSWQKIGYLAARWRQTGQLLESIDSRHHRFWDACTKRGTHHEISVGYAVGPHEPAYILNTGGTTGRPKAVTLSHANIVANAWQQMHWAGATMGQETMLAVLPFFHCYGMSAMLAGGVALGATLVMQPRFHTARALKAIETYRPTVFHAVPAMLRAMNETLRRHHYDLSALKWVISGGASLPIPVAEEFAQHSGANVVEGYGLSEASPVTHVGPLDGCNELGTIGLPLPDTLCRIVDPNDVNKELANGEIGELLVRGPQVMLGYWNNPEATNAVLKNGWLSTGDLALRTSTGFYKIVDRKKDLIITNGFNVYPNDVEAVIRTFPCIKDVAIVGAPDEARGEIVKAFLVIDPKTHFDEREFHRLCKEQLAAHKRPVTFELCSGDLPRNFLGKVIRRELRSEELAKHEFPSGESSPGDSNHA